MVCLSYKNAVHSLNISIAVLSLLHNLSILILLYSNGLMITFYSCCYCFMSLFAGIFLPWLYITLPQLVPGNLSTEILYLIYAAELVLALFQNVHQLHWCTTCRLWMERQHLCLAPPTSWFSLVLTRRRPSLP